MYTRDEPVAFQRSNQYRPTTPNVGYTPPAEDDSRIAYHANMVENAVRHAIREALGLAGMRALLDVYPCFFDDLSESVKVAYLEGHYDRHLSDAIQRGNEAWNATGRMLAAILHTPEGEDCRDTALRVVAARDGIDLTGKAE